MDPNEGLTHRVKRLFISRGQHLESEHHQRHHAIPSDRTDRDVRNPLSRNHSTRALHVVSLLRAFHVVSLP
jgi:hypothetical protein